MRTYFQKIATVSVGCVFILVFCLSSTSVGIGWKLRCIPATQRHFLDFFFRSLVSTNHGCYVFFGDKPASLLGYREHLDLWPTISSFSPEKKGFEVWQKYKFLFPSKSYEIVKVNSRSLEDSIILLIHKKRLLKIVSAYFSDFQVHFSQYASPKDLWQAMLQGPTILGEICFEHELLLGLILGFGKDHSALFARKAEIVHFLSAKNNYSIKNCLYPVFPSAGFATLQQELEAIERKSGSVILEEEDDHIEWALHFPVGFLVDTQKEDPSVLRSKYQRHRKAATTAYEKGNYLQKSLYYFAQ